ncbi:MAG: thioredoxin domain-containing protein [Devosia sp.]|nr:thioredoxin domain-containing protein [Devosia sp.]
MANRRNILIGTGAAAVVAAAGAGWYFLGGRTETASAVEGALPAPAPGAQFDVARLMAPAGDVKDHPLGANDARVVMIEYLSPTCPHCKAFALDVYPQIKAEYIDTNKIQFIPRPFMRNVLDAVVFMLAEAAGEAKYHDVLDTFFKTQAQWAASDKPADAMFIVAQQLGFTRESYDAALTNQTLYQGLEKLRDQALNEFKLQGTPTFYVNGKMLDGEKSLEALRAEIDPLLA